MTLQQLLQELDIMILDMNIQIRTYDGDLIEELEYNLLVLTEIREQLYRLQDLES